MAPATNKPETIWLTGGDLGLRDRAASARQGWRQRRRRSQQEQDSSSHRLVDFPRPQSPCTCPHRRRPRLETAIEQDALLVADGVPLLPSGARALRLSHQPRDHKASERRRCEFHRNTEASRHLRLKTFLRGRHGVATKYLDRYLVWYHLAVVPKLATPRSVLASIAGLTPVGRPLCMAHANWGKKTLRRSVCPVARFPESCRIALLAHQGAHRPNVLEPPLAPVMKMERVGRPDPPPLTRGPDHPEEHAHPRPAPHSRRHFRHGWRADRYGRNP
jgi:hypothetical protein